MSKQLGCQLQSTARQILELWSAAGKDDGFGHMPDYSRVDIASMRQVLKEFASDFAAKSVPSMSFKVGRHGHMTSTA